MKDSVCEIIYEQLGGQRFVAMTGANHLIADGNTLRMYLPANLSGANRLYVTLDVTDTYTMRFFHYTPARLNRKTMVFSSERVKEIKTLEGVYYDQLQVIFKAETGMDTHL